MFNKNTTSVNLYINIFRTYSQTTWPGLPAAYSGAPNKDFVYTGVKFVSNDDGLIVGSGNGLDYNGVKKQSDKIDYYIGSDLKNVSTTCGDLKNQINNYADAYSVWALAQISNGSKPGAGDNPPPSASAKTSCNITGIGWLLCPVLTAGAGLADDAYKFLANNFLEVNTALVNTDPNATTTVTTTNPDTSRPITTTRPVGTGAYKAWGMMRSFANVAFVIAFLIIIFSQLTGVGINAYGVSSKNICIHF